MRVHSLAELTVDALFKLPPDEHLVKNRRELAGRREPGHGQDAADRSRADAVPEDQELILDAPVTPPRVLRASAWPIRGRLPAAGLLAPRSGLAGPDPSTWGGTMTTPGPVAQASATVNAQAVRVFSLGPHAGEVEAHAVVPGLGNVTATSVTVPPSASQQMLVVVKGLSLTTGTPAVVLVQPRQAVNQNMGWSDEYAVQVITTSKTEIQVLVRRLDLNSGWGQSLRLDLFIVD
jgi:hypothetical protein